MDDTYSSNLTELTGGYYGNTSRQERIMREVLFNGEAVIDLISITKKSNQKILLKLIKVLKKYELKIPFEEFKSNNIDEIKVELDEDTAIKISMDRTYSTNFTINKGDEKREIDINVREGKPSLEIDDEDFDLFKEISPNSFGRLRISELKTGFFLIKHKELLIKAIKDKRELLNSVSKGYTDESKELNKLLEPLLTLEKL